MQFQESAASAGDSDVKSLVSSIVSGVLAGTSAGSSGHKGQYGYGNKYGYNNNNYGQNVNNYGQNGNRDTSQSSTSYGGYHSYGYKPTVSTFSFICTRKILKLKQIVSPISFLLYIAHK